MQAALDLAGQGFQVLLVERQPSIGGVMVGLNKVFPTLDCSSCICTPRMAEVAHHERITLLTYTEVQKVEPLNPGFRIGLLKKPRYVVEEDCIGCSLWSGLHTKIPWIRHLLLFSHSRRQESR
jgi:heterodisulfide reductase subunit A